jgi:hypothetical protein
MILFIMMASFAFAQSETIFTGIPTIKISEAGVDRIPEKIDQKRSVNLKCIISKINDKYYWASRENTLMLRVESGAFITFLALNGSGFVRVVSSGMKQAVSLMSNTESKFDYVEHLLIGLRSVTYYGSSD